MIILLAILTAIALAFVITTATWKDKEFIKTRFERSPGIFKADKHQDIIN